MRRQFFLAAAACLLAAPLHAETCRWREPTRNHPAAETWTCAAIRWADGDTLTAACEGMAELVRIRLRGVDTVERGHPLWRASRAELQRRTESARLAVLPHHLSRDRVVADVLVAGENVGAAMDADGWSKDSCPRR